jgi:hypothetical protein
MQTNAMELPRTRYALLIHKRGRKMQTISIYIVQHRSDSRPPKLRLHSTRLYGNLSRAENLRPVTFHAHKYNSTGTKERLRHDGPPPNGTLYAKTARFTPLQSKISGNLFSQTIINKQTVASETSKCGAAQGVCLIHPTVETPGNLSDLSSQSSKLTAAN